MMLSKLFAPLLVADLSGSCPQDQSRLILSCAFDATNHRGSSTKLVRGVASKHLPFAVRNLKR